MTTEFFYDFNSPYAYLSAQRVDAVMPVTVLWQPIAFGVLIRRIGKTPWSLGDEETVARGKRDCEQRAARSGLPPITWAPGWPAENYSLLPLRAAVVARGRGLLRQFSLAVFRQNFVHGRDLRDVEVIVEAAREVGMAADDVRHGVVDPMIKDALRARTDAAIAAGITGIPTVVLPGGRKFWGDDRLDEAARAVAGA